MSPLQKISPFVWMLAASFALLLGSLYPLQNWGGDFSCYIMQARSIVEGTIPQFMAQNAFSVNNSPGGLGPLAYPWGTPLMLAPVYALVGLNMVAFRLLYMGLYLVLLISLYLFARSRLPADWTLAFVALFALNKTFLDLSGNITSDLPFAIVTLWTLFAIGRFYIENKPLGGKVVDAVLVGLLCFACLTLRTNGIFSLATLLGVQVLDVLTHRHAKDIARRVCFHAIPLATCVLCYGLWLAWLPSGEGSFFVYLKRVTPQSIWHLFWYNMALLGDFFSIHQLPNIKYITAALTLPLAVWGAFRHYKRYYHFIMYTLATFALYTIWPFTQGIRFFLPIFPLYLFFVFLSLVELQKYALRLQRPQWVTWGKVALCGVVTIIVGITLLSTARKWLPSRQVWMQEGARGPYTPLPQDLFKNIREHTDKDSIIVFFKPRVLTMFTGRRAALLSSPQDFTDAYRGAYLCIYHWQSIDFGQPTAADIEQMQAQGRLEKVYSNKELEMFRIR